MTKASVLKQSIREIIRAELGEPPNHITQLLGGVVNKVFSVALSGRECVIRMAENSLDVYRKEQWVMQKVAEAGVPVPQVYQVGQNGCYDYMLLEKIDGLSGAQFKGDTIPLIREMGRMVAVVNTIPVDGYGFHLSMKPQPHFTETWLEVVEGELSNLFNAKTLVQMGALTEAECERAEEFLSPMRSWNYLPHLAHGDVSLGNTMMSGHILDWTQAKGAPAPYFDLSNFTVRAKSEEQARAFVEGYGLDMEQYEAIKPDVNRVGLSGVLRGAVWAFNTNHKRLPKFVMEARNAFAKTLGMP